MKFFIFAASLAVSIPAICFGQTSVKLYGQQINATDVQPKMREFGPQVRPEDANRTVILAKGNRNPAVFNELYGYLGSTYTTTNFSAPPEQFLNRSTSKLELILDSINYEFYAGTGFDKLAQTSKLNALDAFQDDFRKITKTSARREMLKKRADIEKELKASRYTTTAHVESLQAETKILQTLKLGLKVDASAQSEINAIATALKALPSASFKANLKTDISRAVERSVSLTNGAYYEIRLENDYIKQASIILKGYESKPNTIRQTVGFNTDLSDFLKDPCAGIVTGAAVFEGTFNKASESTVKTAIVGAATANLTNPTPALIQAINAQVDASLDNSKTKTFKAGIGHRYYYIRFVYSKALELGADNCNSQ